MTEIRKTTSASKANGQANITGAVGSTQSAPFRRTASSSAQVRSTSSAQPVRRTVSAASSQAKTASAARASAGGPAAKAPVKKTTAASSGARPTTAYQKARSVSAPQKKAAPQKKSNFLMDNPVVGRVQQLMPKNVNWPLILVIAISVLILVGIITLMSIGISRCANGCSESKPAAQPTSRPQIHLTVTATPEPGAQENQGANGTGSNVSQPAVNPVTPNNGLRTATIRTMGDFVIHTEVFHSAKRLAKATNYEYPYNFAPMLDPVWDVIGNADFTVTNVDGCLGGESAHKYGYRGYPQFNTPQYILCALRDSSVDMLTLANNHMLDGWFDGLMKTIENVEYMGLKHVGASRTQEERNSPVIYEINGIKVGFLNYTEDLNTMDQQPKLDKRAMQFAVHAVKNSDCKVDAKTLRDAGADVIVCFMHWGTEYSLEPDRDQKTLAQKLVECGVDVIIGGHPHVVQRAEWLTGTNQFGERQETLCLYSLGNFLSFQREQYKDGGIIFDFTIQEQADGSFRIINPGYLPTWVWLTGNSDDNYNFQVLNIADYINNPPATMTNTDYQKMLQSYNDSVAAMSKGVGSLLTK